MNLGGYFLEMGASIDIKEANRHFVHLHLDGQLSIEDMGEQHYGYSAEASFRIGILFQK